jgi:hypothetical protein
MADVEAKRTDFTSPLVYDVSRWGRLQDLMKAPTTSRSSKVPASGFTTAPSSLRTMGVCLPPYLRPRHALWPRNTGAISR